MLLGFTTSSTVSLAKCRKKSTNSFIRCQKFIMRQFRDETKLSKHYSGPSEQIRRTSLQVTQAKFVRVVVSGERIRIVGTCAHKKNGQS